MQSKTNNMKVTELNTDTVKITVSKKDIPELERVLKTLKEEPQEGKLKTREELEKVGGYWIDAFSNIYPIGIPRRTDNDGNIFKTRKQAEASIAKAMLSQLVADYNGDWSPNWEEEKNLEWYDKTAKSIILPICGEPSYEILETRDKISFLAFPTKKRAKKFAEFHKELIEKSSWI